MAHCNFPDLYSVAYAKGIQMFQGGKKVTDFLKMRCTKINLYFYPISPTAPMNAQKNLVQPQSQGIEFLFIVFYNHTKFLPVWPRFLTSDSRSPNFLISRSQVHGVAWHMTLWVAFPIMFDSSVQTVRVPVLCLCSLLTTTQRQGHTQGIVSIPHRRTSGLFQFGTVRNRDAINIPMQILMRISISTGYIPNNTTAGSYNCMFNFFLVNALKLVS